LKTTWEELRWGLAVWLWHLIGVIKSSGLGWSKKV